MSNKSILLIDDEESILTSISWVLQKNNFSVTTASDGQRAIELLRANRYDLVITDLIMPRVDGIAVLKHAKTLHPDIGVIVLTGYGDVRSAVETLKLGADDYLQKPCDFEDLLSKANRSFEKQDLVARLRSQNEQLKNEITARKKIELQLQQTQASLEQQVKARTAELTHTVDELQTVLTTLLIREKELQDKNQELQDTNTTLSVVMKRRERELRDIRQEFAAKTLETVLPLLKKAQSRASGPARDYMATAQANLLDVFTDQPHDNLLIQAKLAPRELQIINYIRQNKTTKEIADLLGLTISTVESYRENIREKLRLKNKKINLKKFLTSRL
ncbi:response regulator [Desulfopila sp. IMCC35006]|uniref:response regulator n=1 Tax=Desulfopila sp. IMCC35006 TaxID=2569542 RepID=UPI00142F078E|nr:response regulator [Desulfopila sp. IMCC35006]